MAKGRRMRMRRREEDNGMNVGTSSPNVQFLDYAVLLPSGLTNGFAASMRAFHS